MESPPGVGFSISNIDYASDKKTTDHNLAAIVDFFNKYPELKNNKFYITGESYAGIYIPLLADTILNFNNKSKNFINLSGFMIGNACTLASECTDTKYLPTYYSIFQFR